MKKGDAADIDIHVRVYVVAFVALMALTLITVAVSYLDLSVSMGTTVALIIAAIKGSLVVGYFLRLITEKKLIAIVLVVTVLFFLGLLLGPAIASSDTVGSA